MTVAAATLSLGEVLGKAATLAMFSLLARTLGAGDFGMFNIGIGVGLLLTSAVSLGFDQRLVQLVGTDPTSLNQRCSSLLALRTVLAALVVGASLLVCSVFVRDEGARTVILVLLVAGCLDAIAEGLRTANNIVGYQVIPAGVLVTQRLLALGFVALAACRGASTIGVSVAYCAASAVGLALMVVVSAWAAGVRPRAHLVSRAHVLDFLRTVGVTGINDLASMALFRVDVILLAGLAGSVAVAHYTAAYRLLETVLFISWSICRVVQPAIADRSGVGPERSAIVGASLTLVFALYVPYAVLLLTRGTDIVGLLFGDDLVSPAVVICLAAAPLAFGFAQLSASSLLAVRPDRAVLTASTAALVFDVAWNVLFIPRFGAAAAALGTSLSYLLQAAIVLRALSGVMTVRVRARSLVVVLIASLVTAAVLALPLPVLLAMAAGLASYALAWGALSRWLDPVTLRGVRSLAEAS